MRRFLLSISLPVIAVLAACSRDRAPLPSEATPPIAAMRVPIACRPIADDLMQDLMPGPMKLIVRLAIAHLRYLMLHGKVAQAQTEMFHLWDFVLKAYYAGKLPGGMSAATQDKVLDFGQLIYCAVGLDGSGLVLGDPLGSGNVTRVVFPSTSTQDVVHGSGNAGVRFFPASLTKPTTVSISIITQTFAPFNGPLNTIFDQYGPFFEFHVVPDQPFADFVLVAQCLTGPVSNPPETVHLAHNVGAGLEILFKAPVNGLVTCNTIGQAGPSLHELFARRDLAGAIRRLGERAASLVTPELAWAGGVGVGGKTKNFSPFGGVDTAVVVEPASAVSQTAPAGSDVASAPRVLVHTTGAHTPLPGATVTFTITAGGGSLTAIGNATHVSTVTAMTDATGTAAVASWTVGVGANSVNAAAVFPPPASGDGVGIDGSPVGFSATGSDVVPWQAAGYRYSIVGAGGTPGFEAAAFNDAEWLAGPAAFGSGSPLAPSCPLDATVGTSWPAGSTDVPTDILLRHTFSLPPAWTNDLTLSVAIDNDIQVFVNGTDVTYPAGSELLGTMITHENCATRGSSTFAVPRAVLHAGTNVLAIRARDRGGISLVDAQLVVTPSQ